MRIFLDVVCVITFRGKIGPLHSSVKSIDFIVVQESLFTLFNVICQKAQGWCIMGEERTRWVGVCVFFLWQRPRSLQVVTDNVCSCAKATLAPPCRPLLCLLLVLIAQQTEVDVTKLISSPAWPDWVADQQRPTEGNCWRIPNLDVANCSPQNLKMSQQVGEMPACHRSTGNTETELKEHSA